MHVREIPTAVLRELVTDPQIINVRQFAASRHTNLDAYDLQDFPDSELLCGEVDGLGLSIHQSQQFTSLDVHRNFESAIINPGYQAIASLVAGRQSEGIWTACGGTKMRENLWFVIGGSTYQSEELGPAQAMVALLGRIAQLGQDHINSGRYETSSFFENDIAVPVAD